MSSTAPAKLNHERETPCLAALEVGASICQFARVLLPGMEEGCDG